MAAFEVAAVDEGLAGTDGHQGNPLNWVLVLLHPQVCIEQIGVVCIFCVAAGALHAIW